MDVIIAKKLELETLTELWLSDNREDQIDYLTKENQETTYVLSLAIKTDVQIEEIVKTMLDEKEALFSFKATANKDFKVTITQCNLFFKEISFRNKELARNFAVTLNNRVICDKDSLEDFIEKKLIE